MGYAGISEGLYVLGTAFSGLLRAHGCFARLASPCRQGHMCNPCVTIWDACVHAYIGSMRGIWDNLREAAGTVGFVEGTSDRDPMHRRSFHLDAPAFDSALHFFRGAAAAAVLHLHSYFAMTTQSLRLGPPSKHW